MRKREAASVTSGLPHPFWRGLQTAQGFPFFVCTVTGAFLAEPPPSIHDFRGGFFCDEPVGFL